jgi:hypothetical protein
VSLRASIASAALLLLPAGCGARPAARPESPASPQATPVEASPEHATNAEKPPESDADRVVAEALITVSRRRQLPAKGPVRGKTVDRDEMVERVRQEMRREVPAPIIAAQSELLFGLGTVPKDFDYEKSLMELMGAQLAGFYEPEEKTMFLARDLPPLEQDATLAHELVHALQDQHYDLKRLIGYRDDASDEQGAIHALAEGDATSAMMDHMLAPRGMSALDLSEEMFGIEARGSVEMTPGAANVPSILKRSVIAPYVDGVAFVNWARRSGGWEHVDQVWARPPVTTEQLLHVEKYVKHEPAEPIAVPSALPKGPKDVSYHDILGEESVAILFEEWMPRRVAVEAAAGWAGDRIAVFEEGKRHALAWHVRYDDEASAARGLEAFARGVLRPEGAKPTEWVDPKKARAAAKTGSSCQKRPGAGPFAVFRKGRDIALVAGPWEREKGVPRAAGDCAAALGWAKAVAAQR